MVVLGNNQDPRGPKKMGDCQSYQEGLYLSPCIGVENSDEAMGKNILNEINSSNTSWGKQNLSIHDSLHNF